MRQAKLVVRKSIINSFFWYKIVGSNGKILCHSEVYTTKQSILKLYSRYFYHFKLVDLTKRKKKQWTPKNKNAYKCST